MRLLPSGSSAVLVEVEDLDAVLALYAALQADPPSGVLDMVPAARTVLLITDPAITSLSEVADAVRSRSHQERKPSDGELIELPVTYDGADLDEVARKLGCDAAEVVRRHTEQEWTVAFCGFAPGFGYLVSEAGGWNVARRSSPRTKVPAGAVGLAGEFTGVYPRESPGGWQIIGRTDVSVFDLSRDPPALFRPGTRVRFLEDEHR